MFEKAPSIGKTASRKNMTIFCKFFEFVRGCNAPDITRRILHDGEIS